MNLDVGCGLDKKERCIGVDIDWVEGVDVIASASALPFKSEAFAHVVTQECIILAEYEGDETSALAELERVLKPGGTLTYNCWKEEPYLKLIKMHKEKGVGTYKPRWWLQDKEARWSVPKSTFESHTFTKT